MRDRLSNFHGNQLVYLHWPKHLSFSSATAFPLPPAMPFGALTAEIIPTYYGMHPDFANIDWARVEWTLDGKPFTPAMDKSLAENNVGHKSVIQFRTPGLDGVEHSCS
ncbi:MAG TPA: phenol hydroxylase subunit P4 [Kofleriaceae bacterium]